MWLEASDGLGGTLKSEVVTNSFMMVNKQSDSYDASKKYLLLQNVKEEVTNFIQTTLLQYAVYVEDGSSTELNISLTDINTGLSSLITKLFGERLISHLVNL